MSSSSTSLARPLVPRRPGFHQFPVVFEQHFPDTPYPISGGLGFQTPSMPLVMVSPALARTKLLFLPGPAAQRCGFRFRSRWEAGPAPWHLPKVWPPATRGPPGFFVIHGHAGKGLGHPCPMPQDRISVRAFPGSHRSGPSARRPGDFRSRSPEYRLWVCHWWPATHLQIPMKHLLPVPRCPPGPGKSKVLNPMDSNAQITGQDHEIGPECTRISA